MRYFRLISNLFLLMGCSSPYKSLQHINGDVYDVEKFRPVIKTELYHAYVDVIGKHLSGLLLLKTMQDSSIRIVFSNEIGIKYFDFEFTSKGKFIVHFILEKMNHKAVLSTLRKDFQLILMQNLDYKKAYILKDDQFIYYVFPVGNELHYFISEKETKKLDRIESGTISKIKVRAKMQNYSNNIPDSISISHSNFNFTISLKRVIQ